MLIIDNKNTPVVQGNSTKIKNISITLARENDHISLNLSDVDRSQCSVLTNIFQNNKTVSQIVVNGTSFKEFNKVNLQNSTNVICGENNNLKVF